MTAKTRTIVAWIAQITAAVILGQTLLYKFFGAKESVELFEQLGAEPWGRWAVGVFEAITVLLLLVPRTAALGGLAAIGLMVGAIGSHLTVLGIEHAGDGGMLFVLAIVTLLAGATAAWLRRHELPLVGRAYGEQRA